MSQENVELVLTAYGAMERAYRLPSIGGQNTWRCPTWATRPGHGVRGLDGVRQFWTAWLAAWEAIEFRRLTPGTGEIA